MIILRGLSPQRTSDLAMRAWAEGVTAIEVPAQGIESLRSLEAVAELAPAHDGVVGAGSIIAVDQIPTVRGCGAQFTLSPAFVATVSAASQDAGMPHLPGVASPTDVHNALNYGHRWQKLFPASILTPAMITALHGPYPRIDFMATGGVSIRTADDFFNAGARAVSLNAAYADSPYGALSQLMKGTVPNRFGGQEGSDSGDTES